MITVQTKSANYDPENIKFFHSLYIFALEIYYFPVLLSVGALLARSPKRNKRKVVSGSRVTLPENFAYKPGLSFNPLARVTLAIGLPYLLVNRALEPSATRSSQPHFDGFLLNSPQCGREYKTGLFTVMAAKMLDD